VAVELELFEEYAQQFKDKYPHVTVKIEAQPTDWSQVMMARIAAGTVGDMNRDNAAQTLAGRAMRGLYQDLGPYVEADGYDLGQFYQVAIEMCTVLGNLYTLPWSSHPGWAGLMWAAPPFDDAGIDRPDVTWTTDDLIEVAQELTKDTNGDGKIDQWGYFILGNHAVTTTIARTFGGNLLSNDGTKSMFSDPKTLAGIQFIADAFNKYKISPQMPGFGDRVPLWTSGKMALIQTGIWDVGRLGGITEGFEWGVLPGALGPEGDRGGFFNVNVHPIWKDSKHPDVAWEFLKHICTREAGLAASQIVEPGGRPDVWRDPLILNDPTRKPWGDLIEVVPRAPMPANTRISEWGSTANKYLGLAYLEEMTVEEMAAEADQALQEIIELPLPRS
jgi:multiple sugar transport system substrate-binding protein